MITEQTKKGIVVTAVICSSFMTIIFLMVSLGNNQERKRVVSRLSNCPWINDQPEKLVSLSVDLHWGRLALDQENEMWEWSGYHNHWHRVK